MKIGSLCTGYGGLDMAVEKYFGAETLWTSEIDKNASIVVQERIKKPNLGDLKKINWETVEPIDILTAGYPCQPFSHAGQRKGTTDERHIWPSILEAIGTLRPKYIILENVRGHLSLGFKEVLKDLAICGYDAIWRIVRASDAGAPHRRERLFIIAQPTNADGERRVIRAHETERHQRQSQSEFGECCEIVTDADGGACQESRRANRSIHGKTVKGIDGANWNEHGSCIESIGDTDNEHQPYDGQMSQLGSRFASRCEMRMRGTPNPLDLDGKLNPVFVEYMMGLPEGWVTSLPISRSQQLKILGNGVVPQQAFLAIALLMQELSTIDAQAVRHADE
jgi:DNA (cytosine-5)-methyltransferase 1